MKIVNLLHLPFKDLESNLLENCSGLNLESIMQINLCRENLFYNENPPFNHYINIEKKITNFFNYAIKKTYEIDIKIFLLPLVEDYFYETMLHGVMAHTDNDTNVYIYLNINKQVPLKYIQSICVHEYQHLLRNSLKKKDSQVRLIDVLIDEGCSEIFVEKILGETFLGPWAKKVSEEEIIKNKHLYYKKISSTNFEEIQNLLFGNNLGIPHWFGYSLGYAIVKDYLRKSPEISLIDLIKLDSYKIYTNSKF